MKKFKIAVFALTLAVLMTGCKKDNAENNAETTVATTASATEKAAEAKGEKVETEPLKDEPETLFDLKVEDLYVTELICEKVINREENDSNIYYERGNLSEYKILSENSVQLTDTNSYLRNSAGFLFFDEKGADIPINDIMESIEWKLYYKSEYAERYPDFSINDPVAVIDIKDGKIGETIETDRIIYSCDFKKREITGFIRKTETGFYEIIPDPAYCHGMPLFHKTGGDCYHRINDLAVYIDSPVIYSRAESEKLDGVGEKFIYAKMTLTSRYLYSTADGYISCDDFTELTGVDYTGNLYDYIDSFEILTEDTDTVLTSDFTPTETQGKAYETYKVLAENRDKLQKEDTVGIILADLDFDGTPEVIASRAFTGYSEDMSDHVGEAEIYRIKDGGLVYIDTLKITSFTDEMFISCGEDHNSKDAWVYMPAENNIFCRTFKLEGDKLVYEDTIRTETEGDNSYTTYLGNKLEAVPDGEGEFICKGYDLAEIKGQEDYVVGMAKEDYFRRFDKIYNLFAYPFVHIDEFHPGEATLTQLSPESRAYTYGMAYLCDAYFNGEYISAQEDYIYTFTDEF